MTKRKQGTIRRSQLALVLLLLLLGGALSAQSTKPFVDKIVLDGTIQPVSQGQLERALAQANSDGAEALLIQMDTPGGLVTSMRSMAGAILISRVPVIVYVGPAGARAGSAGFFLLEAADVAAMAPGTNAGAAHVVFEGGKGDETLKQKAENDAEAFLRSYASRRGRNVDAAIAAVQASKSYAAEEALSEHLVDLIAPDDATLLKQLNGRKITRMDGTSQSLNLANAEIRLIRPTLRENVLGWLVNPNIAVLFLVIGALLIYLEFNTPGTIVPGALGTLMVLMAVFALDLLPIRYTAVLLLMGALVLLVLEAKVGGHGALAIGGVACLALGMMTMVAAPIPELQVSGWVAFAVSAAFGGITVALLRLAVRARRLKIRTGADALVGHAASAMEPLNPEGHVLVDGEIWLAVADGPIAAGAILRVTGKQQNLLKVAAAE